MCAMNFTFPSNASKIPPNPTSNFMSIFTLALSTQLVPPIYTWVWGRPLEHGQHTGDQSYKKKRERAHS